MEADQATEHITDQALICQCLEGDTQGFDALVRRHYEMVFAVAVAHLRDGERADELAQEVFLRAFLHLPTLKLHDYLPGWLCRITRNLATDWLRRGQRESRLLAMVPLPDLPEETPDVRARSARQQCETKQETSRLKEALSRLPAEEREVVLMHFNEGLTKSEIARRLEVHPSSVGRLLDRTLDRLRRDMGVAAVEPAADLKARGSGIRRAAALGAAVLALTPSAKAALVAAAADTAALAAGATSAATAATGAGSVAEASRTGFSLAALAPVKKLLLLVLVGTTLAGVATYRIRHSSSRTISPGQATSPARQASEPGKLPAARPTTTARVAGAAISGIALDDSGKPAAGVRIHAFPDARDPEFPGDYSKTGPATTTGSDGSFGIQGLPTYRTLLIAESDTIVPTSRRVYAPARGVEIRLKRQGGTLSGRVLRHGTKEPAPGASVTLVPADHTRGRESAFSPITTTCDVAGTYRFERLREGDYRVKASWQNRRLFPPEGNHPAVRILDEFAQAELDLTVYPGHTIEGVVRDSETAKPLEGVTVSVPGHETDDIGKAITGPDGRYRLLTNAPYGRKCWLWASLAGYEQRDDASSIGGDDSFFLPTDSFAVHRDLSMSRSLRTLPLTVSGGITDDSGRPIAGATVTALNGPRERPPQRSALSTDKGQYELTLKSPGYYAYVLRADAPGYAPMLVDVPAGGDDRIARLDVRLETGAVLSGRVVDQSGIPVAAAHLTAKRDNKFVVGETMSDAEGRFTLANLPRGSLELYAAARGCANLAGLSVHLKSNEQKSDMQIKLAPSRSVSGRVTDEHGHPMPDVWVNAVSRENPSGPNTSYAHGRTGDDGLYRIDGLAGGTISLNCGAYGYDWAGLEGVLPGQHNANVTMRREAYGLELLARVVDATTSQPIENCTVHSSPGVVKKSQDAAGVFRITQLESQSNPTLTLRAPGYADVKYSRVPVGRDRTQLTIRMRRGGIVTGRVMEGDRPAANVPVTLDPERSNADGMDNPHGLEKHARTDAGGRFRFETVQPYGYTLRASIEGSGGEAEKSVRVTGAETGDVGDLVIRPRARILGHLLRMPGEQPVPDASVKISGDDTPQTTSTDGGGRFCFAVKGGNFVYTLDVPEESLETGIRVWEHQTRPIVLILGGPTIEGRVTCNGVPAAARITVERPRDSRLAFYATADESGRFKVTGMMPGKWRVSAVGDKGGMGWMEMDVPETGRADCEVRIGYFELRARLLDESGAPVAERSLTYYTLDVTGYSSFSAFGMSTDTDGLATAHDLFPGKYLVSAGREGDGAVMPVEVVLSEANPRQEATLRMVKGSDLRFSALSIATGKPVWGTSGQLYLPSGAHAFYSAYDKDGTPVFRNVPPGKYKLEVKAPRHTYFRGDTVVTDGKNEEVTAVLSPAGAFYWSLHNRNGVPLVGVKCALTPDDPSSLEVPREGHTDPDGDWELYDLLPGSYTATATSANGRTVTERVNIVAGQDVKETSELE